jgi:hypothetical protein
MLKTVSSEELLIKIVYKESQASSDSPGIFEPHIRR